MKKVISLMIIAAWFFVAGCSHTSGSGADAKGSSAIAFETTEHDFGTIAYGGDGSFEFVFSNTGSKALVLNNVRSSCGCTVPQWPRDPIAPGEKGTIKVNYNTRIIGTFSKSITVYPNSGDAPVVLKIRGKVEEPAK